MTKFPSDTRYSDSEEFYRLFVDYILEHLENDEGFCKRIYKHMIRDDLLTGTQVCLILYDQEILDYDDEKIAELKNHTLSPFDFMMERIRNLEITPAQLALDPCTGSCVLTDVTTGELLACVTYPGYDNNRLANTVDSGSIRVAHTARSMYQRHSGIHVTISSMSSDGSSHRLVTTMWSQPASMY